ncbi:MULTISPECIES: hypothetical protein [Rhizobium]|nr:MULTISPECIES: hypothetical protein [Rhizobium]MBY3321509.1 hypothetical protein [Rhizobium laguerreae]MBY3362777.1 hypothetical protein [Rhizobium laguerreae]MCA2436664.1 hypothetical protein [Rhizobium leguminosarum]NEH73492.1 hypothetical protein [Rhizobium leguminosarum]
MAVTTGVTTAKLEYCQPILSQVGILPVLKQTGAGLALFSLGAAAKSVA